MVCKSILKKTSIPFGVITTANLFIVFNKANAETKAPFQIGYDLIRNKINIPLTNQFNEAMDTWLNIGKKIYEIILWFQNLPNNIANMSIELLAFTFDLISKIVLVTPTFIFNNTFTNNLTTKLSIISILIVTILTMIESIKQIINNKLFKINYTKFEDILKRYPISIIGAGFAPFLFEQTFKILNWLSNEISKLALSSLEINEQFKSVNLSGGEVFLLIIFDLIILGLMIPIFLQNGKRWWDLFCLSSITPLSLTAWIFDNYRHLYKKWWNNIKTLASTQLVYAIYVALMGILIFSTQLVDTYGFNTFLKVLIIIGGLMRLASPPQFILSKVNHNDDILTEGENVIRKIQDLYETLTFKKIKRKLTNPTYSKAKNLILKNPVLTKK